MKIAYSVAILLSVVGFSDFKFNFLFTKNAQIMPYGFSETVSLICCIWILIIYSSAIPIMKKEGKSLVGVIGSNLFAIIDTSHKSKKKAHNTIIIERLKAND